MEDCCACGGGDPITPDDEDPDLDNEDDEDEEDGEDDEDEEDGGDWPAE